MAILYDLYYSPGALAEGNEVGSSSEGGFHARVVGGQTLSTEVLVDRISKRSSLAKGDVLAVLSELNEELAEELLRGNRVHVRGLGYFCLTLKAPKDAHPNATRAQHIQLKDIIFRSEKQLREVIASQALFERRREKIHSPRLTDEQLAQKLSEYFREQPLLTHQSFCAYFQYTRSTGQRILHRLVAQGKLVNIHTAHYPIYQLGENFLKVK